MKKIYMSAAMVAAMFFAPALAQAADGVATANVNMRSGPSTRYPAVVVIPYGVRVNIHGCLQDRPWCDVSFSGGRGWVAGQYVQTVYQRQRVYVAPQYYRPLGIPTITFDVDTYWGRNYRNRDFYRDRNYWRGERNRDQEAFTPPRRDRPDFERPRDPRREDGNWRDRNRENFGRDRNREDFGRDRNPEDFGRDRNRDRNPEDFGRDRNRDRNPEDFGRDRNRDRNPEDFGRARNRDRNPEDQGRNRDRTPEPGRRAFDKNGNPVPLGPACAPGDVNCS